jgi:TPR repeat protein
MTVLTSSKRAALLGAVAAILFTGPALTQTSPSASSSSAAGSSASVPDVTTVTIFGKKRQPGDITRAQIDTHTANSCGFMNNYDPNNEDIIQDYLRDFGEDQNGSNQMTGADDNGNLQNTDQSDPNQAGNTFKDNTPFGDASQDNAANANTLSALQVGQGGARRDATGACGPSDKAFAAGRNYIARTDTSLKDAFAAFDARDYAKAVDLFKKSYDKMGYDQAALMEGKMLLAGMGGKPDTAQAIAWLKKVVEARFDPSKDVQAFNPDDPTYMTTRSDAAMLLGKIYLTGWGVRRDLKQSLHYYEKAAEFGYIPANEIIGEFYEYGSAGDRNPAKAVTYFTKAAHVGYAPAQYQLGVAYYNGDGVAQDKPTAAAWLIEAAKHGNADALYAVGNMYDQGDTLPNDPAKAIVYFKEAAQQGYPDAEDALGLYFYTGTAVTKDLVTARKLFAEAARGRSADAMFNLAVMMANGEGGVKDMASAYVYMRLAQQLGVDKAGPAADELQGKLTPEERAKADGVLKPKASSK